MRPTMTALLTLAAAVVVVGSCAWAWTTHGYWTPAPLYSTAGTAGLLAALAFYLRGQRLWRALGFGVSAAFVTLVSTALITISRWEL